MKNYLSIIEILEKHDDTIFLKQGIYKLFEIQSTKLNT